MQGEGFIPPGAFAAITRFIFLWSCRGRIYAARAFPITAHSPGNRGRHLCRPYKKAAHRFHGVLPNILIIYPISGFRRFPHTDLVAQLHTGLHLTAFERLQKLLGRFAAQGVGVKLHRRDGGRRLSQRAAVIQ